MMVKTFALISALFLLSISAYAQFEGVINMKMITYNDAETTRVMYYAMSVKKAMMAAEVTGSDEAQGKFIFRGDRKVLWIVDDKEKTYVEMSLNDSAAHRKPRHDAEPQVQLRKTGKTSTILGYPCEEWIAGDGEEVSNIWGTTKLGNIYEGLAKSFGEMGDKNGSQGWESRLADLKVFPLRIVTSSRGKTTEEQEVTGIQKKSVSSSVFDPPAGYKKQSFEMDLGKMMKGMQGSGEGSGGDSVDVQKLMQEMQKKMQEMKEEKGDTSEH